MGNAQSQEARFDPPRTAANYVPLTPLSLIARAARVHPNRTAIVHGDRRFTWAETEKRCRRLASSLALRGVKRGDVVAVMAPNIPPLYEAHFGIPMLGASICAINVRLDAPTIGYILSHSEAKALIADTAYAAVVRKALAEMPACDRPILIDIADTPGGERLSDVEYESLLTEGDAAFDFRWPQDEWDTIALNYTSGTTGKPKGVLYHHRGAYLNALGNVLSWEMPRHAVYLWTLPMFHCNGWCFAWTMAALAGTNICLRRVEAAAILEAMDRESVTHLCGAPIVVGMLLNSPGITPRHRPVHIMSGGAPLPAAIIERMEQLGFRPMHAYGLTEVYGPSVTCEWKVEWNPLPLAERAPLTARQGVPTVIQEALVVLDSSHRPVPPDGATMGEIAFRGNAVMKGYFKDRDATERALQAGWFHSGDLAVCHPDGYVEIKDRAKDIIISGGENISSVEIEATLHHHPAVMEAAVVASPDPVWGEIPCAFVTLKPDSDTTEGEVIAFCRERLAHFKAPRRVIFGPLPKTGTGKIQKYLLRQQAHETTQADGSRATE